MFYLLSMRNGCRQGKTPARSRLSYRATGRETAPYLYPLSPAKLGVFEIPKRTWRRDLPDHRKVLAVHSYYKKDGILASALIEAVDKFGGLVKST